ncbi:MAG: thioredoxin family protein [Bacteroidales bacterium]|nr:thioredoxin family protein [Bacteroidales bacterium]MDD4215800.1 thioredoxin family protein [Bacteroidales bacterium]MDY0142184.1 thioredoxin family protein [Bacteroidales bacterium]
MKLILFLLAFVLSIYSNAQINRTIFDERTNQEILYGECNTDGFTQNEFGSWFNSEYERYNVADTFFNPQYSIPFDSIYVFLGTWCSDTKRELPRFCKIMEDEYFNKTKVRYFGFDGHKQNDVINSDEFNVQYLPTFVFYYKGKELGRIVETAQKSLEEDIMDLLMRVQEL